MFTAEQVKTLFDSISPKYDLANRLLSFGLDQRWRKKMGKFIPDCQNIQMLDLATGTADQIIALMDQFEGIEKAVGIDLSREMLEIGRKKLLKKPYASRTLLQTADAQNLPFADKTFDLITMSFGIRNTTNPQKCIDEMHRVLCPGGRSLILEFSLPKNGWIKAMHLFYLRHLLPIIGGIIAKNRSAYKHLNQTIESFPYGKKFCIFLQKAGFTNIALKRMTLGTVTIYMGEKCKI